MRHKHRSLWRAVSVSISLLGGNLCIAQTTAPSQLDDQSTQELLTEVRSLRAEVKDLHTQLEATKAALPENQAEIAKVTDEVIKDAEQRSMLMDAEGMTAAYYSDRGAIIQSEDGNFMLHPWAFVQIRAAENYRDHTATDGSDSEFGLEIPRMKFILDGNVISPDTTYQFVWATDDATGDLGLQDAWVRHHFYGTPFALKAGNLRDPADHESYLYATKSLTPDRSIVNSVMLNGDNIVKGAQLEYNYDDPDAAVRGIIAFTSGMRNFDTTFQSFPTNGADWGAAARVEWKLMGNWKDYTQFTSLKDKETLLVLGAGADYTEAGNTGALTHIFDAQYNLPSGLGLYAAYLGRFTTNNSGPPDTNGDAGPGTDTYDATVRLMASYLINQRWEPFARYEYIDFDGSQILAGDSHVMQDITLGCNYYWFGHRAKFSGAMIYLPQGAPVGAPLGDILINDGSNELLFQAQFQLMI